MTLFATGTRILTARGEIVVEALRADDTIETVCGGFRPLAFLGRRRVDCIHHPEPPHVRPVRVRADAFADGVPSRDLRLSPNHAVLIDDVLLPIRCLIDGVTIIQEAVDEIVYWRIELPAEDVIFAEGLPCASCPDPAGRTAFENGGTIIQLHPRFASRQVPPGAATVTKIRGYLLDRSAALASSAVSTSV